MQLYILGKNNDDKGTQLEQLTVRILEYQGLENIQTNLQGAGGNEIDITAYKLITVGLKPQNIKVIGECKAHNKPIETDAWLKFIAKVDYDKKDSPHTIGMMICLSGANGPVMGLYNEKHNHDETIQLIANSDLIKLLSSCYNLESEVKVRERLVAVSYGDIYEMNLIYYDRHLYWATSFMDGNFTLSYSNGQPMKKEEFNAISPFIGNYSPYIPNDFVDIREFVEVQQHLTIINLLLLAKLVTGFNGSIEEAVKLIQNAIKDDTIDTNILLMAIDRNPFALYNKDDNWVRLKGESEIDLVEFYHYVLYNGCPVELLSSEYYQNHINRELLDRICELQYGIEIPDDKLDDCLFLFRHSPSALRCALTPNELFQGYTIMKRQENMRALYVNTFLRFLTDGFVEDFCSQNLWVVYLQEFKISDMEVSSEIKIKVDGVERCFPSHSNMGLYELQEASQVALVEKLVS